MRKVFLQMKLPDGALFLQKPFRFAARLDSLASNAYPQLSAILAFLRARIDLCPLAME
jgi:hypothetical protein